MSAEGEKEVRDISVEWLMFLTFGRWMANLLDSVGKDLVGDQC